MNFLIDAQLPRSLKKLFLDNGHDCIHTLDLSEGNDTPDSLINQISILEERILITKDGDFLDSFILIKQPYKLVLVKLGNCSKKHYFNILSFILMKSSENWKQKISLF